MKISYASEKISRTIGTKDDLDTLEIAFSAKSTDCLPVPFPFCTLHETAEEFYQADRVDNNSESVANGKSIGLILFIEFYFIDAQMKLI